MPEAPVQISLRPAAASYTPRSHWSMTLPLALRVSKSVAQDGHGFDGVWLFAGGWEFWQQHAAAQSCPVSVCC